MEWYYIVLIVIGVLLFLCFLIGFLVWKMSIPTPPTEKYENKPTTDPEEIAIRNFSKKVKSELENMNMEEVWIKSKDGLNLHAYYKEAEEKTNKTIISVHGWHGTALSTSPIFSHFLTDYNYNILFIDLRSYGKSDGKYTTYGVKDSEDLVEWINYLIDRTNGDVLIALFGISMGGNTVISIADKVPKNVKCIIDDCGFTTAFAEFKHILNHQMHLPTLFLYFAELINKMICGWGYRKVSGLEALKNSKVPVLFIHGGKDTFVPTKMGEEAYSVCASEKEMKIFDNAKHARSYFMNKEAYKNIVLSFLAKKL